MCAKDGKTFLKQPITIVIRQWFTLALLLLVIPWATAEDTEKPVSEQNTLQVFVRDGCPHCAEAKVFLPTFANEHPSLQIIYRNVNRDEAARDELVYHSKNAKSWPPGVPTFVFNERVLVGFESPEHTGPKLTALVEWRSITPETIETEWLGTLSVSRLGLPLFTLAVGLLDGFNPCAMWVLLFLLSMLVHLQDRMRMALIAGTFVLVSGAVYYAFMAAWLNVFLAVGMSSALRYTLAIAALIIGAINVKDFMTTMRGASLSIPASAKPGLYARMRNVVKADSLFLSLLTVTALAVVVNFIELLCTAGLPAMFTAILAQYDLSTGQHYAYLGLYILAYMADDSLMVTIAVLAMSSHKLTLGAGRWLKLLSGSVMLLLAAIMILKPEWLL